MIPFFSRMFPSTNLQDLNLDWICRRIMELSKGIIAPWINSQNQHWMVYDTAAETFVDSGVSAAGEGTGPQGEPGKSPVIGSNGNWYTWDPTTQAYTDTGTPAEGPEGTEGPEGPEGPRGPGVNRNMLDNWYFVYGKAINNDYSSNGTFPVNQRGRTTWSNAGEYTVDRWKLTSGTASLGAVGLTLNGTLVQIREKAIGQPVTCSALLSDGSMITPTYNDSTKTFTITATGQTIMAAKLEVGTEQTLSHQESGVWVLNDIPDYVEEFLRCQRYFRILESNAGVGNGQYYVGLRAYSDSNARVVQLPLPFEMAKTIIPSLENEIQGQVYDGAGTVATLEGVSANGTNKAISLNVSANLSRSAVIIYCNSRIYLSAEL